MTIIDGYNFSENLYQGTRTEVYRGTRTSDNKPVIIKVLRNPNPTFKELVQFRNQYVITRHREHRAIVRPLALERYGNGYALVMPDEGAIALSDYWQQSDRSLVEFTNLAMELADALHYLTRERIIHKDIKPANILIHPKTGKVKLIDFSISSLLPKEQQQLINPNVLEGTLAYISPEQTGRMNRGIDYRTDFYSVGVTFFELLTGQLPFATSDPMELVHCHIAQGVEFPPIREVPEVLQEIVVKLMAKNAEDRYQSALGLKHDLYQCLQQLEAKGKITPFFLGQRDMCSHFIIPEKLYGREAEVQTLLSSFDRVSAGATEMMLVAGFSGIGKTAVVSEVHKPIVEARGYFIKGKFDQFNRSVPFSAFVQAFRSLMGQLLGESDAALGTWKEKILDAVGTSGQVISSVIPELERIIGSQPTVPELSGSAAQNRFNLLFDKFVRVFTTKEHPLVIFLDDLQWADSASLNLLKLLVGSSESGYLLVLGAYRDNEVFGAHPLMLATDEISSGGTKFNTLTLAPLGQPDITRLVASSLLCSDEIAAPLSQLVYQKTQGNPFFTTQFLQGLHEEGCIVFDVDERYWQCDLTQVRQLALTDDVVEFMVGRLRKLPQGTQSVLKLAACIGNRFDLETLAVVCDRNQDEVAASLWPALQEGLVVPESETYKFFQGGDRDAKSVEEVAVSYRFLHDRVQQAAYSLIPNDQKETTHYHIGQLLLQQIPPSAREDRIFELVSQLNYGTALITQQKERDELAELNLIACRKARAATAYQAGRSYASTGLSLLGENAWQRQYEMSLAFHDLGAELASLCGDFQEMKQFAETVIARSRSLLDQTHTYRILIITNGSQNKLKIAITIAIQFLQALGVTFPESPTQEDIQFAIAEIEQLIGDQRIEDFASLPRMTSSKQIAIVEIANSIIPATYAYGSPLFPLLAVLSVKLSIQYGNISSSALTYAIYGIITCNMLPNVDTAVKFGQLGLTLASQLDAKTVKPEVLHVVALFILHRKSHVKEALPLSQESYVAALEVGNLEYAGYAVQSFCINSLWSAQPLATFERETRAYSQTLVELNQLTTANWCRIHWQVTLNLLGATEDNTLLSGEALQEATFLPPSIEARDFIGLFLFYLNKLMLCYLFGEIELANKQTIEVRRYLNGGQGSLGEPVFYFYESLSALGSCSYQSKETYELLQIVEKNQKILQEKWAKDAELNHKHKVDLVAAEKCRVFGQQAEAIELYDRAIAGAKANEYIQEEALANELAAKFYLDWGKEKVAQAYMQEAYYCYARWGAKAKTDQLERKYPQLLHPLKQQASPTLDLLGTLTSICSDKSTLSSTGTQTSDTNANTALDLLAILKASQAISSTIDLEELLGRLTEILLQNSGGDRCAIVLWEPDSQVRVRAIATAEGTELEAIALEDASHLPVQLIQYVKHARETVVMDSPDRDLPVVDRYLAQRQPMSVLCMPLVEGDRLRGVLYLENQATKGVFQGQLVALNLLATTAAIALENARLYQQARDYARQLEESQLQLVQSEKMSALGNLVAGVGHEIKNPLGFVSGNIAELQTSLQDITEYLELYESTFGSPGDEIESKREELDIGFLLCDLPNLLSSMRAGCDRIHGISTSLRTFSRADTESKFKANLHEGIESTLLILKYRLKAKDFRPEIQVIRDYGELPDLDCFPGQLNQVFMNLLANAIDMFDEMASERSFDELRANPQRITIRTQLLYPKAVEIRISDNGQGMSEEVRSKIFDRKFTTKAVGKGTGLGLAIARQIVEEKHGGAIACQSQLGKGTEFIISLPLS